MRARHALRVVIAEDSAVIRAGIAEILTEHGHEVPAAVGDGASLANAIAEHHPDVVIVDVRMPPHLHRRGPARRARHPP